MRRAITSVEESLAITMDMQNQLGSAAAYGQMVDCTCCLGETEPAEEYSMQAVTIGESMNLPDVYTYYANLANIARDLCDAESAAQWQAKCQAKWAELQRVRRGESADDPEASTSQQLVKLLADLAQAAYTARTRRATLSPNAAQALAQPPEHNCQEHQTPLKRYCRGENVWYSHKTDDGKWSREK